MIVQGNISLNTEEIKKCLKNGDAFIFNPKFDTLTLQGTKIGDTGAILISKSLSENDSLTSLNLSDCGISDKSAEYLASSLKKNYTLENLKIARNEISNDGATIFLQMLNYNTTLKLINLSYNKCSSEMIEQINKQILENSKKSNQDEKLKKKGTIPTFPRENFRK